MIYLIKAYGEDGPLLKIGYTNDLGSRMAFYKTHTPDYKLLDTREGDLDLEAGLHKYFKDYRYSFEWFRYDKFIVDNFKTVNPPIELTVPANINARKRRLVLCGAISDLKIENKNRRTLSELLSRILKTVPLRTNGDIEPVKEYLKEKYLELTKPVLKFFEKFYSMKNSSTERMKLLCTGTKDLSESELNCVLDGLSDYFRNFYLGLGPDRCKALGYEYTRLKKDYETKFFNADLVRDRILSEFLVGSKRTTVNIKSTLRDLYKELGYRKSPKASDLEEYFEIRACKVKDLSGNWINGFEILSQKNTVPPKSL